MPLENRPLESLGAVLLAAWTFAMPPATAAQDRRAHCRASPEAPPPWRIHNNPPPAPALVAPADGTAAGRVRPVFVWSPVIDPEGDSVTFRIQIDDDVDFSSPAVDMWVGSETSFSPQRPLPPATYCWRVRSIDDINAMSRYSAPFEVAVESAR